MAGRTLRLLAPADVERLVEGATDAEDLPFWAQVWPSASGLARFLAASARPRETALELGCGVGAAGLAARALGFRVLMTDRFPDAAALAQENARRNDLEDWPPLVADWRRWPVVVRFPLVLGSDILYEPALHPALKQVLQASLQPGGAFIAADPCRRYGLDFAAALESEGWAVKLHVTPPGPDPMPVVVYEAVRP